MKKLLSSWRASGSDSVSYTSHSWVAWEKPPQGCYRTEFANLCFSLQKTKAVYIIFSTVRAVCVIIQLSPRSMIQLQSQDILPVWGLMYFCSWYLVWVNLSSSFDSNFIGNLLLLCGGTKAAGKSVYWLCSSPQKLYCCLTINRICVFSVSILFEFY